MLQNPYNMSKCLTKQNEKRIVQINNKEKLGVYYIFMEKSIQSPVCESGAPNADNLGESAEHNETECRERIERLNAVLESPDSVEDLYVRSNSRMDGLHVALNLQFHLTLKITSYTNIVRAKLFNPRQFSDGNSQIVPAEMTVPIAAFDVYESGVHQSGTARKREGSVILFNMSEDSAGETFPPSTAIGSGQDKDDVYGAVVKDDAITYFQLAPKKEGYMDPVIIEFDPSSKEAASLQDELDKFLKSREDAVAA